MSGIRKDRDRPASIVGTAGAALQAQAAKAEAAMMKVASIWGHLALVSAANQAPTPEDRIAAAIAVRAAQVEMRACADLLGDASLRVLAAFDCALGEAPN